MCKEKPQAIWEAPSHMKALVAAAACSRTHAQGFSALQLDVVWYTKAA